MKLAQDAINLYALISHAVGMHAIKAHAVKEGALIYMLWFTML